MTAAVIDASERVGVRPMSEWLSTRVGSAVGKEGECE